MTVQTFQVLRKRAVELGPFSADATDNPTAPAQDWTHWRLARDVNQVAWLLLDKKDTKTNVLSRDVLEELGEVLKQLKADMPKGLVLRSAKDNNFCVGADITEFQSLSAEADFVEQLKAAQAVADKLASLPCPTVAVIHGTCLGGGLELALCCDYRLALPGAQLGLPEILLGLHPGLGGTARMTHLINPVEAMKLMLTGKTITHDKAKSLGLVDKLVEERHVQAAVEAVVAKRLRRHKQGLKAKLLNSNMARGKIAGKMRQQSADKAPPQHYPAPEALIKLWEKYGGNGRKMRREEIKSFAKLLTTDTAQNLIRVFFLRENLKRQSRDTQSPAVRHVHVMGAGAMGGDIAGWMALQGLYVSLYDKQPNTVADAVKRAAALCGKKHLSSGETRAVLDRLVPDLNNAGVRTADVVIEAVPENIELKQKLYADIEPQLKAGALLATNTSSIPLEKLGEGLVDPSRLVGLHFFNPVAKMQLVEVVHHAAVGPEALARAQSLVGQIGRLPAPVSSAPGFLVNRVLTPYLLEAMILLDEGLAAEAIDQAALDFGMPMGPVELADQVGLDICTSVADMLRDRLGEAVPPTPAWLRQKVEDGHLGRKSGRGLYTWENGKPKKVTNPPATEPDTIDRLILPMLNACMACLREGVIENDELLDGAMIFGTGFAPFRGGPLHYARTRGFTDIADRLQALSTQYGERFAPDHGWSQHS